MSNTVMSADTPLVRTRLTWLGYSLMAYFAFGVSLMGPAMPFIAEKMGLTYTEMGYHFMLMSAGTLVTSLIGDRIARRVGNTRMAWGGAVVMALALFGIVSGTSLGMTLTFTLLYGLGGGLAILVALATITHASRQHPTKAFTEANIGAGMAMILGPVLIGFIAQSALGWQAFAVLPLLFLALIVIIFRDRSIPDSQPETATERPDKTSPLPALFWVFGLLMFLGVTVEFLTTSWSANFLAVVVGYPPSTAAALVSVFAVAIVLGRLVGRRLLDFMPESRLLIISLVWILLTFPVYWLSTLPILNVAGLFLMGLGAGNLGPLTMSGAMIAAGDHTNRASARLGLFPSMANLAMPQLVGILADLSGIQRAYAVVMVVVIAAIAIALSTNRMRQPLAKLQAKANIQQERR